MRERLTKEIALGTGLLVLLACIGFAAWRNVGSRAAPPALPAAENLALGKTIFNRELCAACHSVGGEGNLRHPLDGVGSRLSRAEIKMHIAPPPELREHFADRVYEAKQEFRQMPPADLEALADYLGSLKKAPGGT